MGGSTLFAYRFLMCGLAMSLRPKFGKRYGLAHCRFTPVDKDEWGSSIPVDAQLDLER